MLEVAQAAVPGDEDVLHDHVVAAGAAQADGVPHVDDGEVRAGDERGDEVDRLARGVQRQRTQQDPRRVVDPGGEAPPAVEAIRSEEHTSELQSLMRLSYALLCLKKKINI